MPVCLIIRKEIVAEFYTYKELISLQAKNKTNKILEMRAKLYNIQKKKEKSGNLTLNIK